ncbi:MAG: hypothetical protein K6G26_05555 [Lachnospiraceae bacterium]|nr:hypothetical protein [Lachnospiraceae bacterium]
MNERLKHRIQLTLAKIMNYVLVTIPFALCWYFYYAKVIASPFYRIGNYVIVMFYLIMFGTFCRVYDANEISLHRISEMFYSQVLSFLIADGFIYIVICILCKRVVTLVPGLLCILGQIVFSYCWCRYVHIWYFRSFPAKKTIIVFDDMEGLENLINEYGLSKKFNVEETMQIKDCMKDISALDNYQTIFLSDIHSRDRNVISKYCVEFDKDLYIIPRLGDIMYKSLSNSTQYLDITFLSRE